jgi:hypothetical protein
VNSKRVLIALFLLAVPCLRAQNGAGTFDFGFEQRVRTENWNNPFDFSDAMDDQRNQIRYRTRLWGKAPISQNIDVFIGLVQETNQIVVPRSPYRFDEVAVDNAYIDIKKLFVKGLSLRVGRQNIMKGEGFILMEGDPWDGSRTIYFNAADLAYSWKKSKLELIGISNPRTDRYLPRIHDRSRQLIEWDEQALGTYYTDNNLKHTSVEAYYFYKKEVHDSRAPTNFQYQPDRHVNTGGGRVVHKLGRGWEATGEMALQWGHQQPSTSIAGWGGYSYLKKSWKSTWKPSASAGYWGMSGDDPATSNKVEGWDPLFARWPKFSELYLYSLLREKGAAYWTNLGMWQTELLFTPAKPLAGRLTYYRMNAFHSFPLGDARIFSGGTGRGNLYQARLDVTVNKCWKGHALYERVSPGTFYAQRAPSYFVRFEAIFTVKGSLGGQH